MLKAAFFSLGCKVNQYETRVLERDFSENGFEIVPFADFADVYVVNSCTVTEAGDRKSRALLRRAKKLNPSACTVLTGCFPQAFPEKAALCPEADIVIGVKNKALILSSVKTFLENGEKFVSIEKHRVGDKFEKMSLDRFYDRTRAFLKIEDGCDRYCSYCIIPYARGHVRSKALPDAVAEAKNLSASGYKEIVLTGINLSSYGRDLSLTLADAVEAVCRAVPASRIRLGSLEPDLFTDKDISVLSSLENFCPQFHLALQSGCDETLKRMRRKYDTAFYSDLVNRIRAAFPESSITTDAMVGFPGETDDEFEMSKEFISSVGFLKVHIFPYSRRSGTKAADMPDQIPHLVKEQRCADLAKECAVSRADSLASLTGSTQKVLFESDYKDGFCEGYTPNYSPVAVRSSKRLDGELLNVRITGSDGERCFGELL